MLKSPGALADTSHMPIPVPMELPHESDQPGPGDGNASEAGLPAPGTRAGSGSEPDGVTPERLTKVIRRLETGFYDSPEVREHIARRVREELGP